MQVEVSWEEFQRWMVKEMISDYESFDNPSYTPVHSHDPAEEEKYIKQMKKALARVIEYYGGQV